MPQLHLGRIHNYYVASMRLLRTFIISPLSCRQFEGTTLLLLLLLVLRFVSILSIDIFVLVTPNNHTTLLPGGNERATALWTLTTLAPPRSFLRSLLPE